MLTKITIRNFKLFEEVEIPLGDGFVFIGPNNSGKTSALQALALWHAGLQKWAGKHASKDKGKVPVKQPGVTINRLDLIPLPVAEVGLIWFNRKVQRKLSENIRIDLIVEGVHGGKAWECGLGFDYANQETLYCRPLRTGSDDNPRRMGIPEESLDIRLSFLPPMSGLASEEALIQEGRINVLVGQGQTAEVLRNLCYRVHEKSKEHWEELVAHIKDLFGVTLREPKFLAHRGAVSMDYTTRSGKTTLDLPSSGRGMQQVLLLLAHLYDNAANTVLLLDEPDAHLEILRQGQVFDLINGIAEQRNSQIIAASHSEVLLNQAAQRGSAVAFVGSNPHILGHHKQANVLRSLREIGFEYYCGAEEKGWILYLEGETDLRILRAFAEKLKHPSVDAFRDPLVKYITNLPNKAREHFYSLMEANNDLQGFILLDRTDKELEKSEQLLEYVWEKYEIENYLCHREAIMDFITDELNKGDIFYAVEASDRKIQMQQEIKKLEDAFATLKKPGPFSDDIKASDDFLVPLFENFTTSLGKPKSLSLQKKDFYKLVEYIPKGSMDREIVKVLDTIWKITQVKTN